MTRDLGRLLRPRSVAVVGGGVWCARVVEQIRGFGFAGEVWAVHPKAAEVAGCRAWPSVRDLPGVPDAAFVGVNRFACVDVVRDLAAMGAGGAVCFASGFSEVDGGVSLQGDLVAAAGDMPILGPNCYGFVNAFDGALLWPDQHGCVPVERGVAILTQSSNIAINLTMQQRALPVGMVVTCGNQAQTGQAEIALSLLDDPRVTAIGLHVEGFGDLRTWEALAAKAWECGVPLVALKVGASGRAQSVAVSHTASLTGSDVGAQAFLDRLGIPRVRDLTDFLETLKLLHVAGPLGSNRIGSISCSGGEAALVADMAEGLDLEFPGLTERQAGVIGGVLGPAVTLSNPLDYHTYVWRDTEAMAGAWAGLTGDGLAMTLSVVDYPVNDPTDWHCATEAALLVRERTGAAFGVVSTLPELMPLETAGRLMEGGVVPFMGLGPALAATEAAARVRRPNGVPVAVPGPERASVMLTEPAAKAELAAFGVPVPEGVVVSVSEAARAAEALRGPLAVKGIGLSHKSEHGAVRLGVAPADVAGAAAAIGTDEVLIEEMVTGGVAEMLVGVVRDPAHGFVLSLGAGGVLTEILRDTVSMLLPVAEGDVRAGLLRLRMAPLLQGYRGRPGVNVESVVAAVMAVQAWVLAHADTVGEVEINPLICTPERVVAVDALIGKA